MDVGDRWVVPIGLAGFAGLAAKTGRPRLALRLAGAAEAYRDANEFALPGPIREIVWTAGWRRASSTARAGGGAAARRGPAAEAPEEAVRAGPGKRAGGGLAGRARGGR